MIIWPSNQARITAEMQKKVKKQSSTVQSTNKSSFNKEKGDNKK